MQELAWPHFAALLPPRDTASAEVKAWFGRLLALFLPAVSQLDELPAQTLFVFRFDPAQARENAENAAILDTESARRVLQAFAALVAAHTGAVTPEQFKMWMDVVKTQTGAKGKDLFHPVRIALTGAHSGREFDKLIPILEEGSQITLPQHVLSVRERIDAFLSASA